MLHHTRGTTLTIIVYAILIAMSAIVVAPVLTAILGSIRTTGEFMSTPFGLPKNGIQWENYTDILGDSPFWISLKNSVLITSGVALLNLACASMLAFIFSRVTFRGRGLLFNIILLGLLFPLVIAILPIFIQVRQLHLINSLWGVILPMVAFGLPISTVILRTFFLNIPGELEDAAYIDGCSTFGFFRFILLPLARPALMTVATLQVVASWNEYFLPLMVLNDTKLWPLPLGIMQYQGQFGTDYARVMAYVTLLVIPALAFYLVAEKYIVTGLTGGELKG
jgi:raffinose/stachyose/melibiose transport system permease protein